jgi:hypothetical protein
MKNGKLLKTYLFTLFVAVCIVLAAFEGTVSADDATGHEKSVQQPASNAVKTPPQPPYTPVYRIKLLVHLRKSGRKPQEFGPIFTEINEIWWSQAGICFEIHAVDHDTPLDDGLDMWFSPYIGGLNGSYDGVNIQMTDNPDLEWAPHPARSSAARTAAHELGHAFDLRHRQDSDDNLMRSKTYGWQLNRQEVEIARGAASDMALEDRTPLRCGPPRIDGVNRR